MTIVSSTPLVEAGILAPLTPEEAAAVEAKKQAMDKVLSTAGLAKYKIEIMFGKNYAPSKPSHGAMSFWESGSKFHGGGDTVLYICPGRHKGINECEAFIPDHWHHHGFLVCPKCHKMWKGEDVVGQIMAVLTARDWTRLTLKYYLRLELSADIYIKYHPSDIRSAAQKEQERQQFGEQLDVVRSKRASKIYPLRNIIKDTSAGAALEDRIFAFIVS